MEKPLLSTFLNTVKQHHPKCLGLAFNFIDPLKEVKEQSVPEHPVIFQKSLSCLRHNPVGELLLETSEQVMHEVELGIVIEKKGKNVSIEEAQEMVGGCFLALDFTCSSSKKYRSNGWSFCVPKIRDNYLVVSDMCPVKAEDLDDYQWQLQVNG